MGGFKGRWARDTLILESGAFSRDAFGLEISGKKPNKGLWMVSPGCYPAIFQPILLLLSSDETAILRFQYQEC